METSLIHRFKDSTENINLPEKFTYPFYYEPHPLVKMAAKALQNHLNTTETWKHNFGLGKNEELLVIGKMFGVLVIKDQNGKLGYLVACSGKLANSNKIPGFVPPIFDMLEIDGFFMKEEKLINDITEELKILEANPEIASAILEYENEKTSFETAIKQTKKRFNNSRSERRSIRKKAKESLSASDYAALHAEHKEISLRQQHELRKLQFEWGEKSNKHRDNIEVLGANIKALKKERKDRSNALQNKLFEQYQFLNCQGETKALKEIFKETFFGVPPAGAGECAAPKLLQFAFSHQLTPICMGEFWWGTPPKSEVRSHGAFYPACRGKCEPILSHMLKGMDLDDNPMELHFKENKSIEILFEDEYFLIINKPAEFLSVPGKSIEDSVYLRMKLKFPNATGPLIVHRLDMSTSGLMIIAKQKEVHKKLQSYFIKRKVQKRYVAILDGLVEASSGEINLPLRLDLFDRPRQLVCYEHGKRAATEWELIEKNNNRSMVYFYPLTGRTHQLRVHAAHHKGIGIPIVGDDLYGQKEERLYLHAERLIFDHPITKATLEFKAPIPFSL